MLLTETWVYFLQDQERLLRLLTQHLALSFAALGIALVICLPLGIWIAHRMHFAPSIINLFGTLRLLPSLVILFLALPYLGLGFWPSLVALTILACPPILINTFAGVRGVDAAVREAALGVGMSNRQVLWQVELPLAFPVIIAGIRIAAVEVIASATLAAFIAGGGLGEYITRGFALNETKIMLVGAIAVAVLALCVDATFATVQKVARMRTGPAQ